MLKALCLLAAGFLLHDPDVPPDVAVRRCLKAAYAVLADVPENLLSEFMGDDAFFIPGTTNGYWVVKGTPLVLVQGPKCRSIGPYAVRLPKADQPNRVRGEWVLNSLYVGPGGEVNRGKPYRAVFRDTYMETGILGQVWFYRERHLGPLTVVERSYPTAEETATFYATETIRFYDRRYVLKLGKVAFSVSRPDRVLELSFWYRRGPWPESPLNARKE